MLIQWRSHIDPKMFRSLEAGPGHCGEDAALYFSDSNPTFHHQQDGLEMAGNHNWKLDHLITKVLIPIPINEAVWSLDVVIFILVLDFKSSEL